MWVETKKNNEQLRKEVEVAKEELSSTKKKLEEALVVCTMYTDLYHSFVCINKVLNRSTRFPATLQRFSPQDRYHLIFKPHWIKQQKRENCCYFTLYFNHNESNNRRWKIVIWYFNHTESNYRRGKIVVWYFNHTVSDNNNERFLQGELARAQKQERLEREKLMEKLKAVEAQMQVQTTLVPS